MSDYAKITDYAAKDLLLTGDPAKAIKGTEVGAEFDAIATMSATKGDKSGTLAQFAATTSAQLAGVVSDETGSGALVFATSPTFVTPLLGTPTSGVTDNLTTTTSVAAIGDTDFVDTNLAAGGKRKILWTAVKTYLATTFAALAGSASQVFSVGAGGSTVAAAVRQDEIVGRNKIIGGDFTTNPWQRGTTFTAPAINTFTADRFRVVHTSDGVVDILKTADAPTAAEAGIYTTHCFHADVTTADAAIAAGQFYVVRQNIEGLNSAVFGFGQAGTRYVTLSFWHKHTKIGTYCVSLMNAAADRAYIAEYTQDVTDTWEKATITIQVDTTGTWLYTNGIGIVLSFAVACGSTFQTPAGSWTAGTYLATANQVNGLDNTANNFKLALIQMEAGQVATKFESLLADAVRNVCQRYYFRTNPSTSAGRIGIAASGVTNTSGRVFLQFPVTMRTSPTALEQSGTAGDYSIWFANTATACTSVPTFSVATIDGAEIVFTATAGHTAGQGGTFYSTATSGYLGFSAEI